MSLYFTLHLITISFPLVRSFEYRVKYYTKWVPLFIAIVISGSVFIIWDVIFTKLGVWGFNPAYLSGSYLANLPIEEWLFFVTVPFASIFIYENVIYFVRRPFSHKVGNHIFVALAAMLLVLALINYDRYYTFFNFLGASLLLFYIGLIRKPKYASYFLIAYLFDLIPFFVINGILTGSFIEEPVVWYNNSENLGLRLGTIPVEDTIYALFLLLLNISLYEYFKGLFGTLPNHEKVQST